MRAGTRARTRGGSATCVMKCNECEPDTRFYCVELFSKTAAPTGPSRRPDPGTAVPQRSVYRSPAASGTAIPLPRDAPSSTPGSVLGTFRRRWGCRAASGRVSRLAPRAFSVQTGAVLEPRPYAVRNLRLPREPRVHPLDGAHAAVISKTTTRVEWRKQRESYVRGSNDRLLRVLRVGPRIRRHRLARHRVHVVHVLSKRSNRVLSKRSNRSRRHRNLTKPAGTIVTDAGAELGISLASVPNTRS